MVHPPQIYSLANLTAPIILLFVAILNHNNYVQGWIPRGGGHGMANINGQPNRVPSSSRLFMKKRDKKQRKKKDSELYDVDGIGQIASDNYFSNNIADGLVVQRLEALYGLNTHNDLISNTTKRTVIKVEDWSDLAEGPCLDDCCGDECEEQCEIPEDYKRYADENAKVDVMAFLGIKRVDPIRVQREWE